jgi:hypothetical protein
MARTAVVAGTATAVSNRVSRRQAERWAQEEQGYPPEAYQQAPAPSVADDRERQIAQLKELERAVRPGRGALPTFAIVLVVAACGSDTVDAGKAEQAIEQDLSSTTAEIVSVSCPDGVEQQQGKEFTCDAKLKGGGKAEVQVKLTSDRGDAVYTFKPGTVEVSDNAVEPVLEDSLKERGVSDPRVDCPPLIKVAAGETATCDATGSGGRAGQITFTWTDDTGEIDSSSVTAPPS